MDYYDKNKFSGGTPQTPPPGQPQAPRPTTPPPRRPAPPPPRVPSPPPPRPGQKPPVKSNSNWWYSWPIIILLFAMGLWPIALVPLFVNLFGSDRNKKNAANWTVASQQNGSAAEQAIRRAQERAAAQQAAAEQRAAAQQAAAQQRAVQAEVRAQQAEARMRQAEVRAQQAQARVQAASAQNQEKGIKKSSSGRFKTPLSSKLFRIFGAIFLIGGGIVAMETLTELFGWGHMDWEYLFQSVGFFIAGGALFFQGQRLATLTRRSQRYILAIGNADAMSIAEIAKRVNRPPEKAKKELQKLIDKGYLGEDAYIDHERGYFLRFGATLEEEKPQEAPMPEQTAEGYSGILRNIRRANDRIADPELSRKIDRLEQISGIIFKEVEAHPEKRDSIRTFFDYYLPTTQKLLDAYAEFESTGVDGENLRQAKERIEETMDAIVAGFEHQLDQLYSADAMDVVSDIKVMEAMLNRDTASAAKDFGYTEPVRRDSADSSQSQDDDGQVRLQI